MDCFSICSSCCSVVWVKKVSRIENMPSATYRDLILFYSILFYSRLCPSTAGSSPLPESSIFLCPLLFLSIPLPVAPQCHFSNNVLVFQLILHPLSATPLLIVHLLSFIQAMWPAHFHFVLVLYWTMSVTLLLCLVMVLLTLSFSLTLNIFLSMAC